MCLRIIVYLLFILATPIAKATSASLEISGKITQVTEESTHTYRMSETEFLAMPQFTIRTATNWTPVANFTGVKITDLMKLVGSQGDIVEFHTFDDYVVRIPMKDFKKYGVILARKMNDDPLQISNFGPYFVIYPRDNYPKELKTPTTESKFVWQVNKMIVR